MKRKEQLIPKDPTLLPSPDQIKPPSYFTAPPEPVTDPDAYVRKPVTAAYSIDLSMDTTGKLDASFHPAMIGTLSKEDVCTIDANGEGVVHGRYGKLTSSQVAGIPLEYLSILNLAAEGAAAVRSISGSSSSSSSEKQKGTIVVYGATHPSALAAVQLATAQGLISVAVVGGEHSGDAEAVDLVKGLSQHPGTAVPEEYAIQKSALGDLVQAVSEGEPAEIDVNSEQFVSDFRANLKDYCATFEEEVRGLQLSDAELDSFTANDYAVLKQKFKLRGNSLLGGDLSGPPFEPPMLVRDSVRGDGKDKESLEDYDYSVKNDSDAAYLPFDFSVLEANDMPGIDTATGGPVKGAIIAVTPTLLAACEAVSKATTKRGKAEALQYLTVRQRNAYAAASSVASIAKAAGANVYVVGGALPEMTSVDVTGEDVAAALDAMRMDEEGASQLNFLVQVFRAGDYQSYEDYAIHKATEPLSGPRVKVVTK